jgi:hypothetical protein
MAEWFLMSFELYEFSNKTANKDFLLAEVYNPAEYRNYIHLAKKWIICTIR